MLLHWKYWSSHIFCFTTDLNWERYFTIGFNWEYYVSAVLTPKELTFSISLFFHCVKGVRIRNESIIRIGIACKKIPCYMRNSACMWFIVKKAKIFWNYVKHFWIIAGDRKCRIWFIYDNKLFFNCPTILLNWDIKKKFCFLAFKTFNEKKKSFL